MGEWAKKGIILRGIASNLRGISQLYGLCCVCVLRAFRTFFLTCLQTCFRTTFGQLSDIQGVCPYRGGVSGRGFGRVPLVVLLCSTGGTCQYIRASGVLHQGVWSSASGCLEFCIRVSGVLHQGVWSFALGREVVDVLFAVEAGQAA